MREIKAKASKKIQEGLRQRMTSKAKNPVEEDAIKTLHTTLPVDLSIASDGTIDLQIRVDHNWLKMVLGQNGSSLPSDESYGEEYGESDFTEKAEYNEDQGKAESQADEKSQANMPPRKRQVPLALKVIGVTMPFIAIGTLAGFTCMRCRRTRNG